jgi:hypothetical protein
LKLVIEIIVNNQPALANINFHGALSVDGEPLVRIDGNAEEARVGVDELVLVPDNRVPQDAGIIEVGQAGHVIRTVKLGWVDLTDLISLENFFLEKKFVFHFPFLVLRIVYIAE